MNLHSNKGLLEDAILATAEFLSMRDIYVEKDYWVTVALYEIFHSEIADQSVFKGGTSLSKCHKLIERFSEDIEFKYSQSDTSSIFKAKTLNDSLGGYIILEEIIIKK